MREGSKRRLGARHDCPPAPSSAFADTLHLLFFSPRPQKNGSPGRVAAPKGGFADIAAGGFKDATIAPRTERRCSHAAQRRGLNSRRRGAQRAGRVRSRSPDLQPMPNSAGFREITLPVRARSALLRRSARIQATSRARGAAIVSGYGLGRISFSRSRFSLCFRIGARFDKSGATFADFYATSTESHHRRRAARAVISSKHGPPTPRLSSER